MINILLFKRPWSMDDPYIRVVHSSEGDCVVHAVTALCGTRVLCRKRYCMVEKTSVPQIELVHRGKGNVLYIYWLCGRVGDCFAHAADGSQGKR